MGQKPTDWNEFTVMPTQAGDYECEFTFREAQHLVRGRWNGEAWEFTDLPIWWYGMPTSSSPFRWRRLAEKPQAEDE